MKYYLQLGVILMIFCVIATGILAFVNSVTEPKIEALKAEESIKSREELIPDCDFEEVVLRDGFSYFIATDKESKELRQITKEIVVKFIEMGKITPTSFPQLFPIVYNVIVETLNPSVEENSEEND